MSSGRWYPGKFAQRFTNRVRQNVAARQNYRQSSFNAAAYTRSYGSQGGGGAFSYSGYGSNGGSSVRTYYVPTSSSYCPDCNKAPTTVQYNYCPDCPPAMVNTVPISVQEVQVREAPPTVVTTRRYRANVPINGMTNGTIVTRHLSLDHGISMNRLRAMSLDDQWRLHDRIHGGVGACI